MTSIAHYYATLKFIPLEITDETDDSYYDKVTIEYEYNMFIDYLDKY